MNRYNFIAATQPNRKYGLQVGDRVRPNMEHSNIKGMPVRDELRGTIVGTDEHGRMLIHWDNSKTDTKSRPATWHKEWLIRE